MTMTETTTRPKRTDAQREVLERARVRLARVRELDAEVRPFMNWLNQTPTRGRPFDVDRAKERVRVLEHLISQADPLHRVKLVQERIELTARIDGHTPPAPVDLEAMEARFVKAAAEYGELKGLSYEAWRLCGVPPKALAAAGITR